MFQKEVVRVFLISFKISVPSSDRSVVIAVKTKNQIVCVLLLCCFTLCKTFALKQVQFYFMMLLHKISGICIKRHKCYSYQAGIIGGGKLRHPKVGWPQVA